MFWIVIYEVHTQGAVPGAEVGLIGPGKEDPVPPELVEVDGERPYAALGDLAVELLGALHVGASPVATVSVLTAEMELEVRRLQQSYRVLEVSTLSRVGGGGGRAKVHGSIY
jgi:hypothetical protein